MNAAPDFIFTTLQTYPTSVCGEVARKYHHAELEGGNKIGKSEWKELTIEATTNKGGKKTGRPR